MGRVGIAIHRFREDAVATGREIIEWCAAHGHVPVVAAADLPTLSASGGLPGVLESGLNSPQGVLIAEQESAAGIVPGINHREGPNLLTKESIEDA